jgi:hypothetical protein
MTVASPNHRLLGASPRRSRTQWLIEDRDYDATTQGWGNGIGWGMAMVLGLALWTAILYFAL